MYYDIISKQGNCRYLRKTMNIFHMFPYKPLAVRALILEILFITDYQAHGLLLQMLCINCFHILPNMFNTITYRDTNRKDSFTF